MDRIPKEFRLSFEQFHQGSQQKSTMGSSHKRDGDTSSRRKRRTSAAAAAAAIVSSDDDDELFDGVKKERKAKRSTKKDAKKKKKKSTKKSESYSSDQGESSSSSDDSDIASEDDVIISRSLGKKSKKKKKKDRKFKKKTSESTCATSLSRHSSIDTDLSFDDSDVEKELSSHYRPKMRKRRPSADSNPFEGMTPDEISALAAAANEALAGISNHSSGSGSGRHESGSVAPRRGKNFKATTTATVETIPSVPQVPPPPSTSRRRVRTTSKSPRPGKDDTNRKKVISSSSAAETCTRAAPPPPPVTTSVVKSPRSKAGRRMKHPPKKRVRVETVWSDDEFNNECKIPDVDDDAQTLFAWAAYYEGDGQREGEEPPEAYQGRNRDDDYGVGETTSTRTGSRSTSSHTGRTSQRTPIQKVRKSGATPLQPSDPATLTAKIRDTKSKLAILEERFQNAERYGDHERAQDLKYGAIPDLKGNLRRLIAENGGNDPTAIGNTTAATSTAVETSKDLQMKLRTLTSKLEKARREGDTERVADLKFGAIPETEDKLAKIEVKEKLAELKSKLKQAESQGERERAADLKFGAIPDLENKLRRLEDPSYAAPTYRGEAKTGIGKRGGGEYGGAVNSNGRRPGAPVRSKSGDFSVMNINQQRRSSEYLASNLPGEYSMVLAGGDSGRPQPRSRGVGRSNTGDDLGGMMNARRVGLNSSAHANKHRSRSKSPSGIFRSGGRTRSRSPSGMTPGSRGGGRARSRSPSGIVPGIKSKGRGRSKSPSGMMISADVNSGRGRSRSPSGMPPRGNSKSPGRLTGRTPRGRGVGRSNTGDLGAMATTTARGSGGGPPRRNSSIHGRPPPSLGVGRSNTGDLGAMAMPPRGGGGGRGAPPQRRRSSAMLPPAGSIGMMNGSSDHRRVPPPRNKSNVGLPKGRTKTRGVTRNNTGDLHGMI